MSVAARLDTKAILGWHATTKIPVSEPFAAVVPSVKTLPKPIAVYVHQVLKAILTFSVPVSFSIHAPVGLI